MVQWTSKRTITSSVTTSASVNDALGIVHKPPTLIRLSPLVVSVVEAPQTSAEGSLPSSLQYVVTDRLPIIGGWTFDRSFSADFTPLVDGMDARVDAGLGVRLWNKWRVREAAEGAIIEEIIELEVSRHDLAN
jgi:hypothetical protein